MMKNGIKGIACNNASESDWYSHLLLFLFFNEFRLTTCGISTCRLRHVALEAVL